MATLDKLNHGVLLVDANGRVQFMNRAAAVMLARKDGFLVRQEKLEFSRPQAHTVYSRFLATGGGAECGSTLVLCIDGPRQTGPYHIVISALECEDQDVSSTPHCVFIYEPRGCPREISEGLLKGLYGLTAAEARLASQLYCGKSLAQAAAALGVSINTAKTNLRRVFAKCAVKSQAGLLQLLALGPRML